MTSKPKFIVAQAAPMMVVALGFCAGLGFMAAQELWWALGGWVGLCHG